MQSTAISFRELVLPTGPEKSTILFTHTSNLPWPERSPIRVPIWEPAHLWVGKDDPVDFKHPDANKVNEAPCLSRSSPISGFLKKAFCVFLCLAQVRGNLDFEILQWLPTAQKWKSKFLGVISRVLGNLALPVSPTASLTTLLLTPDPPPMSAFSCVGP